MAKLPDEILTTIFTLQRQLASGIEEASAAEWALLSMGETEATIPELEELQNARERLTAPYSRLHTLLLRILESQPLVSPAILNLLVKTIEQARAAKLPEPVFERKAIGTYHDSATKNSCSTDKKGKLSGCVKATDSWSKSLWHWMN